MAEELVITVATKRKTAKDGFGITDSLGNKYLLSVSNTKLSDALIEGGASKISVARTKYGVYINKAELFNPTVKPPPETLQSKSRPPQEARDSEVMTKSDWATKEKVTRKSIERQKSLELAVEVAKIKGSDSTEKIIATAKLFEIYLEGKSSLIEEAKRLGAKEIKKEDN